MRRVLGILAAAAMLHAGPAPAEPGPVAPVREWRFEATLAGRTIGEHRFRVTDRGDEIEVESRASFDVRFLGIPLYTYEHRANEIWKDGCLAALESRTDDNGTLQAVTGRREAGGFVVRRGATTETLAACTMTFAYWNPALRSRTQLLNPQTGETSQVVVEPEGAAKLDERDANLWVIRGTGLEIRLWYDAADDRWLALESESGGGLLAYRLAPGDAGSTQVEAKGGDDRSGGRQTDARVD